MQMPQWQTMQKIQLLPAKATNAGEPTNSTCTAP